MVGLGEEWDEVVATLRDLRAVGCQIVTIGQYLRPSLANLPMVALLHARRVRRAEADRRSSWASATSSRARSSAVRTTPTNRRRVSKLEVRTQNFNVYRRRLEATPPSRSSPASLNTSLNIAGVNRPVFVFCRDG